MSGDAGCFADIRESTVAIVMKKPTRPRIEDAGDAIVVGAVEVHAACERLIELSELTDEEIKPAIVIVIEPDRAGTPAGSGDASLLRHIREGAVAIVVVEDAPAELRDV